ncbi:MAG: RNA 3'-terminal phosphate cyclase [Rubripirellula sp.]
MSVASCPGKRRSARRRRRKRNNITHIHTKHMLEIDGSQGEGGGQIIRSSLALSAVTGKPIRLTNIRAGRKKPGLLRQHLTAAQAAAKVSNGKLEGAELGSREITFAPQQIRGGAFTFRIGSAGSATLVAQTVLPALMLAEEPSVLHLEGGTHNAWAPPFDFLQRSFLPQLAKAGPKVKAEIERYGFYPAGGGKLRLEITPCQTLRGFKLLESGSNFQPRVTALVAEIPAAVGERECDTIRRKSNWNASCFCVHEIEESNGAGNVVMIELIAKNVTEIFTGFGKIGVKAEHIARGVLREARAHIAGGVPVGEYLADQLMLPMGLAASQGQASEFHTGPLSLHSKTHIDVLKTFLPIKIAAEEAEDSNVHVRFAPLPESISV